jgi:hypothetical protein
MGSNPVAGFISPKQEYCIGRPAGFECARLLKIFAFKEYFTAKHPVYGAAGQHWRAVNVWRYSVCSVQDRCFVG